MSVNVQTSLDQHGLTADEQMAVFAYMNRSQQVNAYEVQQHIAVRFERRGFFVNRSGGRDGGGGARARAGAGSMARVGDSRMLTRMLTWRD
jgi:hypothetical protein